MTDERTALQKAIDEKIYEYAVDYKYDGYIESRCRQLTDELITLILADSVLRETL